MSVLHLVGPVGAWQDLTLRAREVLCQARLIVVHNVAAVHARLDGIGARARLLESAQGDALAQILAALADGEVAWLAMHIGELEGPAQRLVRALLDQGVSLVSVPGGSTMVAGLVASGLPADRFTALGLLPASQADRQTLWSRIASDPVTVMCEVQAGDLAKVLGEITAKLGDRRIAICQGQEVWRGLASETAPGEWDGRVTLFLEGADSEPDWTRERVLVEIRSLLDAGASPRDTAREVARRSGWPRRQVYELAVLASRPTP